MAALLRRDWHDSLAREGIAPPADAAALPVADGDEPACPACGATAGLDAGACRDCGLQLE